MPRCNVTVIKLIVTIFVSTEGRILHGFSNSKRICSKPKTFLFVYIFSFRRESNCNNVILGDALCLSAVTVPCRSSSDCGCLLSFCC